MLEPTIESAPAFKRYSRRWISWEGLLKGVEHPSKLWDDAQGDIRVGSSCYPVRRTLEDWYLFSRRAQHPSEQILDARVASGIRVAVKRRTMKKEMVEAKRCFL